MSIDVLLMAVNELRDTCPDVQIESVGFSPNGIYFISDTGNRYIWDMLSGCVYTLKE